jgi:hypothetical protein
MISVADRAAEGLCGDIGEIPAAVESSIQTRIWLKTSHSLGRDLAAKMCRLPRKRGCYNTFWFQTITKIWRGENNFKSGGLRTIHIGRWLLY